MNLICDKEDVPELIQRLRYRYSDMMFDIDLFNGKSISYCAEVLCQSIGLMQRVPSKMQMLEAQNNAEKLILREWTRYFPYLRQVK
jgi:hypothetical protein